MTEFWKWLLGVITSTGFLAFVAYLMRETLSKFFTKSVDHKFEKKLEVFKSGIRDSEKELEQIRTFIVSARRERDSILQAKRLEAAEVLMHLRQKLSQFTAMVEYLKMLKIDELIKSINEPKVLDFLNTLTQPFNIDENLKVLGEIDRTLPRLYLSEKSLKVFDAYESIIIHSVSVMKLLSISLEPGKFLNTESLSKVIIELAPQSKAGFEKFGEGHALYWATHFYNETLQELRNELFGTAKMNNDTESAETSALDVRRAQIKLRQTLHDAGLSETLIN
ncbi:hypothetical protein [Ewingella americana]|uniref:hypothetical protein n=1 Tax=Ewingella americana TaxID=41202 RepID=UPI00163A7C06|nr:hypothetical protein [Ewingella americana]QMV54208.1 hypothetical protein GXP68_23335 [Ewingella americana]